MDNKLLEKTRNKLKHDLSSEEQEALRKCSSTINTHTRIGATLGGSLSVYGMYRRKLWPLSKYWGRGLFFGIGGIVVGMQLGLVSASIQCVKIVKALPNPDHVMKALREVQIELQDARRRPLQGDREWTQRSEDDPTPSDAFEREGASFGQDTMKSRDERNNTISSTGEASYQSPEESNLRPEAIYNGPGPAAGPRTPDALNRGSMGTQKEQSQNIWQQIRGENGGRTETAWDKLRKGNSGNQNQTEKTGSSAFDLSSMSGSGGSEAEGAGAGAGVRMGEAERERMAQQQEFDRLLEKERSGQAAVNR